VIQGTAVPGKSTRQVETTVEIGNGQTLALAGLLNETVRGVTSKIPGLGDIPIFGALFSSVRYQKNLTELLILVTPELVSPLNPDQVPPVPGEEITSPNDWQLFGFGELEGEKDPPPDELERALKTAQPIRAGTQQTSSASGGNKTARLSLHGPWGASDGEERY
jgi:pilus assembly protein CpaC